MAQRAPKAGDHFLLPFAGKPKDLLVQAIAPSHAGHWRVRYPGRPGVGESDVLLSSCHRCSPSRAARILGTPNTEVERIAKELPGGQR